MENYKHNLHQIYQIVGRNSCNVAVMSEIGCLFKDKCYLVFISDVQLLLLR